MAKTFTDADVDRIGAAPVPVGDPMAAGAAGASRGVLSTLDIVPRGIGAMAQMAARGMGVIPSETPYTPFTPFANLAARAGIGTRAPQTPTEETAAFAGEMLGSTVGPAGLAYRTAGIPGLAMEGLSALTATGGGLATEAAGLGRTPGVLLGGLAPAGAVTATQRATVPMGRARAGRRLAATQRQDVPLSAGQAAGGSYLEKFTETMPGGSQARAAFAERQAQRMGERLDEISAGRPGAIEPSAIRAGREISQGIDDWANRFRGEASQKYGLVESAVAPVAQVEPKQLSQAVETLRGTGVFRDLTLNPLTKSIAQRLDEIAESGRSITYEDMKSLRTMVGRQLSTPSIIADAPRAELKQLYGAISDDMKRTLNTVGGPETLADWDKANAFWKAGMQRIDDVLEPIQKRNLPEDVYKAAMGGTREGATRLQTIRDTLTPEQWDVVVRTAMRRLGEPIPSQQTLESAVDIDVGFSPERLLTNLGRMSAEAREVLFGGQPNLDDIVSMASGIREQTRYLFNPSGTAARLVATGLPAGLVGAGAGAGGLTGAATSAAGLAGGAGLMYLMQKMLQSPAGARMLTQPVPFGATGITGAPFRGASQSGSQRDAMYEENIRSR